MNQHAVDLQGAMQHLLKHNFDATNYNTPQVSKDYIVQQQADWAQPRRVMKPLPGRLPASNRAMKRYIRCNVSIYEHFGWFVQLVRRAFYWISRQAASTISLLIVAGDVQAMTDCMGETLCDVQFEDLLSGLMHRGSIQYIPLKTGFVRQMLAPYSSYSAFVWQAS